MKDSNLSLAVSLDGLMQLVITDDSHGPVVVELSQIEAGRLHGLLGKQLVIAADIQGDAERDA